MSERLQGETRQKPTPEQTASAQKIIDDAKVLAGQFVRETRGYELEGGDSLPRYARYLTVQAYDVGGDGMLRESERYLLHLLPEDNSSLNLQTLELSAESEEGRTYLILNSLGHASMSARDSDDERLASVDSPMSEGQLEFANAVIDVFNNPSQSRGVVNSW